MKVRYFIIFCIVVISVVFFAGIRIGRHQIMVEVQENKSANQLKIIKIQEKINAETFNHSTNYIRDCLRKKYTIAE